MSYRVSSLVRIDAEKREQMCNDRNKTRGGGGAVGVLVVSGKETLLVLVRKQSSFSANLLYKSRTGIRHIHQFAPLVNSQTIRPTNQTGGKNGAVVEDRIPHLLV